MIIIMILKFIYKKKYEICNFTDCYECPLSEGNNGKSLACYLYDLKYPEEAIAKVKAWHEKKYKKYTYRDDFLSKFPDALTDISGHPLVKACTLYPEIKNIGGGTCIFKDCDDCWDMEKGYGKKGCMN